MAAALGIAHRLSQIPDLTINTGVPLREHTRFGIGGPASLYIEAPGEAGFIEALECVRSAGIAHVVIGGGTNLIVADDGFNGAVLRFTGADISHNSEEVCVAAGAVLQDLVDFTVTQGLAGLHTMTGIPGSVGGAVYGNAGAYGRSIDESVREIRLFDGENIRSASREECQFRYRESVFKRNKNWIVFSAMLRLERGDAAELSQKSAAILDIRNRKYPPSMKCAGSIFKNLLLAELSAAVRAVVPEKAIIEGKVPAAWFLEQVGAKGMSNGGIRVASYHANLIYNEGGGTAAQLRDVIFDLKHRVAQRFGLALEEEVQYVGFD